MHMGSEKHCKLYMLKRNTRRIRAWFLSPLRTLYAPCNVFALLSGQRAVHTLMPFCRFTK